jgi:hypothetical protein
MYTIKFIPIIISNDDISYHILTPKLINLGLARPRFAAGLYAYTGQC